MALRSDLPVSKTQATGFTANRQKKGYAASQQQSSFDNLKKAAQNASDKLQSSCPTAVPLSPVARVDTVETRLSAVADAIKSVRPDLSNFYASLSDEQKARFNTMGPPPKTTSSPQQRQSGGQ